MVVSTNEKIAFNSALEELQEKIEDYIHCYECFPSVILILDMIEEMKEEI